MRQCSAIFNVYGYTFGNYDWTNAFIHPIVMVRCTDERNVNMPLFKNNGFTMSGQGKQSITMIAFSVERSSNNTPGDVLKDFAKEEVNGRFYGDITFTIMGEGLTNRVDIPFFANGSGKNFKVRNLAHAIAGTTEERLTYAANNNQEYYDTKGKMYE